MRITKDAFRTIPAEDAPVVLTWEFGRRPLGPKGRKPTGFEPVIHHYRSWEGRLHEAVAPYSDWYSVVREGDELDERDSVEGALLIDGGLWRPSTGPLLYVFAGAMSAWEEPDEPLHYNVMGTMSANYMPDVGLGPLYGFSSLDEAASRSKIAEAFGIEEIFDRAGVVLSRGDIPDVSEGLLARNVAVALQHLLDRHQKDRLSPSDRDGIEILVGMRDLLDGIRRTERVEPQAMIDLMPRIRALISRDADAAWDMKQRRRTPAAVRKSYGAAEAKVHLMQMETILGVLEKECQVRLDRGNELADLAI